MQSTRSHPPIKVAPLTDESPTSWLMRICLKYRISFRDFVSIYKLEELMKQPLNITANLSPLAKFLPEGMELPNTIQDKIESFEWKKGRSEWLIEPNKNGAAKFNSFTRICPKCIRDKGYYRLKWQMKIVECCIECSVKLIEHCPKCTSKLSPLFNSRGFKRIPTFENLFDCLYCGDDLRKLYPNLLEITFLEEQHKIVQAYSEEPVNIKFLKTKL